MTLVIVNVTAHTTQPWMKYVILTETYTAKHTYMEVAFSRLTQNESEVMGHRWMCKCASVKVVNKM